MKTTVPIILAAFLTTASAWANAPKPPRPAPAGEAKQLSAADRQFITDATVGGIAEVEMGKLALKNGESQGVKDFGQRLIDDHSRGNTELAAAAKTLGVDAPTDTDAEHKKHLDMLARLKGADFDRAFATHMVEGHQKMIAKFRTEAADGRADALRTFAKSTLPTLEEHLKIADGLTRPKT